MDAEQLEFFNKAAKDWDANETKSTPVKINRILDEIGISVGAKILDLGTGTGVLIPYLVDRVGNNGKVKGIDISDGMLSRAKEKYASLVSYELFEKKDFEKEEIDGIYDIILLYCVYPHLSEPLATLRRLLDCNLAQKGKIIVAFPADEKFINGIHGDRKIESDLLPSASELSSYFSKNGFNSRVISETGESYIVEITK